VQWQQLNAQGRDDKKRNNEHEHVSDLEAIYRVSPIQFLFVKHPDSVHDAFEVKLSYLLSLMVDLSCILFMYGIIIRDWPKLAGLKSR